jgi:hypothetical protein
MTLFISSGYFLGTPPMRQFRMSGVLTTLCQKGTF